jgi:hypothetical protein
MYHCCLLLNDCRNCLLYRSFFWLLLGASTHDWGTVGLNDSQASQTLMFHINATDFGYCLNYPSILFRGSAEEAP